MRNGERADLYCKRASALRAQADTIEERQTRRLIEEIAQRFERLASHIRSPTKSTATEAQRDPPCRELSPTPYEGWVVSV